MFGFEIVLVFGFSCVSVCLFFFCCLESLLSIVLVSCMENTWRSRRYYSSNLTNFTSLYSMHISGVVSLKLYNFIKITSSKIQFGRFPYTVCSDKVLRIIYYDDV